MAGETAHFRVKHLVLTGDADAGGFTIHNLNLAGLNLTKASVGLGNVDNTSDLNKPISLATQAALDLKEDEIAAGTTGQFWRGDKTWVNYGALALQNGVTTLPLITVIGASPTASATLSARRSDYSSSFAQTSLTHLGAGALSFVLAGLPGANVGQLSFENASSGVIRTGNAAPLYFGINNIKRMRLQNGLYVGNGDVDPGLGCIRAAGTIEAVGGLVGSAAGLTGLVKEQIPTTLRATSFPNINIIGTAGAGYIQLASQTVSPPLSTATIFADSLARISMRSSALSAFPLIFETGAFTAARTVQWIDSSGFLPTIVAPPPTGTSPGVAGNIAYDATHFYVCVAPNVWVRATFATW